MFPEAMSRQTPAIPQAVNAAFPSGIPVGNVIPATRTLTQTSAADFSAPAVTTNGQQSSKDILALWVTSAERAKLEAIDTPAGEVIVRGAVYEVQNRAVGRAR